MMGKPEARRGNMVTRYAGIFSDEIRDAIKAINNEKRQAILGVLICEGELSFIELKDRLGLENNVMWPHLRALEKGGLIENFLRGGFTNRKRSFYRISPFGQRFVKALFGALSLDKDVVIAPLAPSSTSRVRIEPEKPVVMKKEGILVPWTTSRQEYSGTIMLHRTAEERS